MAKPIKQTFDILKGAPLTRAVAVLSALSKEDDLTITIDRKKPKRSPSQNDKLWAIYDEILKVGGEAMAGWTKDDLHEFFLQNHFGSEVKTLFGVKKRRPLRRSSKLSKIEFADFIESIYRFMAEQGVYIA